MVIFVGDDWAEAHHDVEVQDETGRRLVRRRLPEGVAGIALLHGLLAEHAEEPDQVVVGIETEHGLWVQALVAAGYQVYAVNPLAVSRYRERHTLSGAKSDPGDAKVLCDLVRTDRHNHRPVATDTPEAEAIRLLARAHQSLVWTLGRQRNGLRSALREYYPQALEAFGDDLAGRDALAVLAAAPTPAQGRGLSTARIAALLRRAGRRRHVETRAAAIRDALRGPALTQPGPVEAAFGTGTTATVRVMLELRAQADRLEAELGDLFMRHPDAEILRSLPGLGTVLGARVLGEFGDAPNRYADAKARRNYAGTSPITRASGTRRTVLARHVRNRRLADAVWLWAFSALTNSPGARTHYDHLRARGQTHKQALRALANRLVGILHGCLRHRSTYDEHTAWAHRLTAAA